MDPQLFMFAMQMGQTIAQYNALLMQSGSGFSTTPHVQPQPHHSAGQSQYRQNQPKRRGRQTAASRHNHNVHASHSAVTKDDRTFSPHNVRGSNTRGGSAGGPPSSIPATPELMALRHAALQSMKKQPDVPSNKAGRRCDGPSRFVVTNKNAQFDQPWKRRRLDIQPTPNTPAVASTSQPQPDGGSTSQPGDTSTSS